MFYNVLFKRFNIKQILSINIYILIDGEINFEKTKVRGFFISQRRDKMC